MIVQLKSQNISQFKGCCINPHISDRQKNMQLFINMIINQQKNWSNFRNGMYNYLNALSYTHYFQYIIVWSHLQTHFNTNDCSFCNAIHTLFKFFFVTHFLYEILCNVFKLIWEFHQFTILIPCRVNQITISQQQQNQQQNHDDKQH